MKAWLSLEGVHVVERNVDEDEGAYEELVALGFRSVPVTVIGGQAVRGFDPDRLREIIRGAAAGG